MPPRDTEPKAMPLHNFKTGQDESFEVLIPGTLDQRGLPPQDRLHEFISQEKEIQALYFRLLREGKTPLYAFEQCLLATIPSQLKGRA
jgi:hypothetical protein